MNHNKILDISWATIWKIAIASLIFYLIYLMRSVIIWFIFALIISVLFSPAIDFLRRFMPRILATILVYVLVFGIMGFLLYSTAPFFVSEIQQFSQSFPDYFEKISPPLRGLGIEAFASFEHFTRVMEENLVRASANIFSAIGAFFGGIFSAFTIFALALFLSLEEKAVERTIGLFSPKKYEAFALDLWVKSQKKVTGWFGARILCSLLVGLLTSVTCYFLNIKYAISFGFFAGVFNFIPIMGPIVSGAIITVIIALSSWAKAIFFIIAFIIIQQIEGNILSPILTKKFIGSPAVLVVASSIIGAKLWGLMGALLAIPIAGILYEFIRDFLKRKKEEKTIVL